MEWNENQLCGGESAFVQQAKQAACFVYFSIRKFDRAFLFFLLSSQTRNESDPWVVRSPMILRVKKKKNATYYFWSIWDDTLYEMSLKSAKVLYLSFCVSFLCLFLVFEGVFSFSLANEWYASSGWNEIVSFFFFLKYLAVFFFRDWFGEKKIIIIRNNVLRVVFFVSFIRAMLHTYLVVDVFFAFFL